MNLLEAFELLGRLIEEVDISRRRYMMHYITCDVLKRQKKVDKKTADLYKVYILRHQDMILRQTIEVENNVTNPQQNQDSSCR